METFSLLNIVYLLLEAWSTILGEKQPLQRHSGRRGISIFLGTPLEESRHWFHPSTFSLHFRAFRYLHMKRQRSGLYLCTKKLAIIVYFLQKRKPLLYFSFYVEEALSLHENEKQASRKKFAVLLPDVTNHIKIPALCGFAGDWYCMVSNVIDKSG